MRQWFNLTFRENASKFVATAGREGHAFVQITEWTDDFTIHCFEQFVTAVVAVLNRQAEGIQNGRERDIQFT